ncbi:hypothetical protein Tco_0934616 [Tanacetum coccineum]
MGNLHGINDAIKVTLFDVITGSALVPCIYMYQFWHTLKEDGLKYKLKFLPGTKELTMTVADFRRIFQLPQATNNNNVGFIVVPTFRRMVPFFLKDLRFYLKLKSPSNFVSKGLPQPWQTLCKIFARCLTTRVTGHDEPPIQIMQMLFCFINNVHVDYVELLWEGLHYSLMHPTTLIPTQDVPMTQSQPIESTQGTHRITSTPRIPNSEVIEGESSSQRKVTVIRFRLPPRRQDPEMLILTAAETDNVAKVKEHMMDTELYQLVEGTENVDVDVFIDDVLNSQEDPDTKIEPRSDKESLEAEKDVDMVNIDNDEEEESAGDEFELRREKRKGIEETKDTPSPTTIRSPRTHIAPLSSDKETL